jgi:hypothetical protein
MFTAGGARARIHGLALCLLGVGAALGGGCNNNGSYRINWQFADSFQPGDCGRVGVQGIAITATKADNSQSLVSVPCGLGFYDGSLAEGTWTLGLVALDATGQDKAPADSGLLRGQTDTASPVEIHAGEHAALIPPVTLAPLPQCRDGVDNDLDGRVDLDDADCAGNPDLPTECGATDGPSCHANPPGSPDGGAGDASSP